MARIWLMNRRLHVVLEFQCRDIGDAKRRRGHRFPELAQPLDPLGRRVAADQGGVDGADGNPGDPVGMQVGFGQRLVDAGLIGAQRAAALQQQGNPLEVWPRSRAARLGACHHGEFIDLSLSRPAS